MTDFNFKTEDDILSFLKQEKDIKFIRFIFPDVLGREMSFCAPADKIKSLFRFGAGFDGSSVEGFARIEESDLTMVPDPKTFRPLPWNYEAGNLTWREAVIFGDIFNPKGEHFAGDSRYILKKTLEETRNLGRLFAGPELEFFILENEQEPKILDRGGYFYDGKWGEVRKAAQLYLKDMGIETECDHHEVAPSQHEIDLQFSDALTVADSVVLAKYVLKRTARKLGLFISFMPKPITGLCGNGMHLHLSLWTPGLSSSGTPKEKNLFFENGTISDFAKRYVMGLIKYGKEIQIILNQWVNSYKRLVPGFEAPVYMAWGMKNRSAYIRVPEYQPGKEGATRIEIRNPDPGCNIYLALAIIHAAGVQGIKEGLKLLPPEEKDIYEMTEAEMEKKKIEVLASDLMGALEFFKKSELAKIALGEHIFQKIIQNKEIEWQKYQKAAGLGFQNEVSPYEIKEYLPIL